MPWPRMNLRHVVITSVARDELTDGGGRRLGRHDPAPVRHRNPQTAIEVLVPDFKGHLPDVDTVLEARPDVFNHNVETVERLPEAGAGPGPLRPQPHRAAPCQGARLHHQDRNHAGLGGTSRGNRTDPEGQSSATRWRSSPSGQYLQPTPQHLPVDRWVTPEEFQHWKQFGLSIGLGVVESGPLVRSSYHADEQSQKYTGTGHLNTQNALASA